ncbi:PucR family transcriptional regulator [Lachnobacterium bovis]|uniref:Carbohydrate diacid regulator n=1 Tax=Lachnobacterium bovis TaxID=140626 RepID=A0A1H9Q8D6_9FIRM|nr:helix-turn-helix domain-containing protein [Lachnobacterium bovis]SER56700.1 carbohydrate diacid regulator [Lachnobacterium bovis]
MFTNQKLQNTLDEIKEITKKDVALYSPKGKLIAHTTKFSDEVEQMVNEFSRSMAESQTAKEYHFFKVIVEGEIDYILIMTGGGEDTYMVGRLAVCQIRNLVVSAAGQYDRNNFIQNVLLGNMLIVDIFSKARKLHIDQVPRVVFVIDTKDKGIDDAMELVKNLSNVKTKDFVTSVDEHNIVLVKDVSEFKESKLESELKNIANLLVDTLQMEAMIDVRVGYGNVINQIPEITDSYQEAKMALEVGRVFFFKEPTISYGRLGIGRLIHQLPMSLCDMFIKEVFGDEIPEILDDEESMSTIMNFFSNNLNISETARQLYVHRNTLVYRLERIEKAIGLDIRKFDDAMTFRIAVMVIAHMKDQKRS